MTAKNIVIATGSEPSSLPGVTVDEKIVVTSTGALTLPKIPEDHGRHRRGRHRAGDGLRLRPPWHPGDGRRIPRPPSPPAWTPRSRRPSSASSKSRALSSSWAPPCRGSRSRRAGQVTYKLRKDDSQHTLDADTVLVATGRKPYTDGLGLDALGVDDVPAGTDRDRRPLRTNVPGIYAIGDCIAGPMLAHKAEDEGMAVAEIIAGQAGHVNYGVIPGVIYTTPRSPPSARPKSS